MNRLLARWLSLPLVFQSMGLCLVVGVLLLSGWHFGWGVAQRQAEELLFQQQRQARHYRAQIKQLCRAGPLSRIEAEISQLQATIRPQPLQTFSLLKLTTFSGGVLAGWQPLSQGAELTMNLSWEQVQKVFSYLSTLYPGVELMHFTLIAEQQYLRLHLIMAMHDDA